MRSRVVVYAQAAAVVQPVSPDAFRARNGRVVQFAQCDRCSLLGPFQLWLGARTSVLFGLLCSVGSLVALVDVDPVYPSIVGPLLAASLLATFLAAWLVWGQPSPSAARVGAVVLQVILRSLLAAVSIFGASLCLVLASPASLRLTPLPMLLLLVVVCFCCAQLLFAGLVARAVMTFQIAVFP
jgi:hypothetical protein